MHIHIYIYICMYIYLYIYGAVRLIVRIKAKNHKPSLLHCIFVCGWIAHTRQLPGFSVGWRNGLPSSSKLLEIIFVKIANFHPNEPSTKRNVIWNEASQKSGFGNSDPPLMTWLAGRLAAWLALLLPSAKFSPKPTVAIYTLSTFASTYARGV